MNLHALLRRACCWGVALAAAACLAVTSAHAARATDPIVIPFPIELRVEPPNPCADSLVSVRLSHPLDSCLCVTGATADSGGIAFRLVHPPQGQRCANACGDYVLPIGRFSAGVHVLRIDVSVTVANDSGTPNPPVHQIREVMFAVKANCAAPPQPLPYVQQVRIGQQSPCLSCPPVACPNQPVPVSIEGVLPSACWGFLGIRVLPLASPGMRPVIAVGVRRSCPDSMTCESFAPNNFGGTVMLDPQQPGARDVEVRLFELTCSRDSTVMQYAQVFPYTVLDSCAAPPPPPGACAFPFMQPVRTSHDSLNQCDAIVSPGGRASLLFSAFAQGTPLAGIQGVIQTSNFLHVDAVERVGPALGMDLQTHSNPDGTMSFVLWSNGRARLRADEWVQALRVHVVMDSVVLPAVPSGVVTIALTAASDTLGNAVPICSDTRFAPVVATVCIGLPPATCEANGDGTINVADLVRMFRCFLVPGGACADSTGPPPLPDCNADGSHDIRDILCCARLILGSPAGNEGSPGSLHLSFATPYLNGDLLEVPFDVQGAGEMSGALMRVRFPSDRYELATPLATPTSASGASWTPIIEPGVNDVLIGFIRTSDTAPDQASLTLKFRLRAGMTHGGTVQVAEGSVAAANGSDLAVDLSQLATTIPAHPGSGGAGGEVQLSAPRPNPATGRTSFVVSLSRDADVDLAIFDLAGRRVATLWRARMAAGEREVAWQPQGVRSGLYFARLSVDGVVRTTRVTLRMAQ